MYLLNPMFKKYEWLWAVAAITLFSVILHSQLFPRIADTDGFYHLRHAWEYRTSGIFQSAFPWTQFSSIKTYASDIWYGFHIILLPFTFFNPLIYGMYWGAFFITLISLLITYWALKRMGVRWPLFWTFVFAMMTADLLYRLAMLRPHPISLGLTLLLFSFVYKNPRKIKELWQPMLVAAIFTWIHISLSWVLGIVTLAAILPRFFQKRGLGWQPILAVFSGIILGWAARPNPMGAAYLAYAQVFKLLSVKQLGLPLRFGRELTPFTLANFADQLIPITILIILALGFLFSLIASKKFKEIQPDIRTGIWSSALLAGIFGVMTFAVARRSNEIFIGFAIIFISLLFSIAPKNISRRSTQYSLLILIGTIAIIFAVFKNSYRMGTYIDSAFTPLLMQPAGDWLAQHAKPGETVFNSHWDRFGELFFWDPGNYYINGMDPIFEYDFDPSAYWKTHFYAIDAATSLTCPEVKCTVEGAVPTYDTLKNYFHASYIVVEKRRNPNLNSYLSTAPRFRNVFENPDMIIYKIF